MSYKTDREKEQVEMKRLPKKGSDKFHFPRLFTIKINLEKLWNALQK